MNTLYRLIEDQIHLSILTISAIVWPSKNQNKLPLHSNSNATSEHAVQVEKKLLMLYAKRTIENHRGPPPD
jgi:NAD/NADP transhydrogenase alpha subunit